MNSTMTTKSKLEIITGPMFSGKTEELIRRLKRVSIAGQKALVIRPFIDTLRYADIVNHDGSVALITSTGFKPCLFSEALDEWEDPAVNVPMLVEQADVVAVEEAQFFKGTILDLVKFAQSKGKRIMCGGLDLDCLGNPYGYMPHLLSMADTVTKLTSICAVCKEEATRTQAKFAIESTKDVSECVGGADMYEPRCFTCWNPQTL